MPSTMCSTPKEFKEELEKIPQPKRLWKVRLVDDPEKNHNHYLYVVESETRTVMIDSPTDYSGTGLRYYKEMEKLWSRLLSMERVDSDELTIPSHLYRTLKSSFFDVYSKSG